MADVLLKSLFRQARDEPVDQSSSCTELCVDESEFVEEMGIGLDENCLDPQAPNFGSEDSVSD